MELPVNRSENFISEIQNNILHEFEDILDCGVEYIIIDYPNHSNIGDSAIYLGELEILKIIFKKNPKLVAEISDICIPRVDSCSWKGPIFLHGGGNFGDLWPRHQQFREDVIRRFPGRKIIQLPQSIHFKSQENLEKAAKVIDAHPDFVLMVRDRPSFDLAKTAFKCDVRLVPDMAFMMGPVQPTAPECDILCLIRTDQESRLGSGQIAASGAASRQVVDWPEETDRRSLFERLPRVVRRQIPPRFQGYRPASVDAYEWLARQRVARGFEILSRGKVVLTDRLHAHILSLLLGKPHVVLDNSYGKISNFIAAWTQGQDFVQAQDLETAMAAAAAMAEARA